MPLLRQFLFVYLRYEFAALEPSTAQTSSGDQDAATCRLIININTQHSRICWLATTGSGTAKSYFAKGAEPEPPPPARSLSDPLLHSSALGLIEKIESKLCKEMGAAGIKMVQHTCVQVHIPVILLYAPGRHR